MDCQLVLDWRNGGRAIAEAVFAKVESGVHGFIVRLFHGSIVLWFHGFIVRLFHCYCVGAGAGASFQPNKFLPITCQEKTLEAVPQPNSLT